MEISHNLLTAIMFVMILSVGIVNILSWLAGIVKDRSKNKIGWMLINWMVLILIAHFNMFWHTIEIISLEDLRFGFFLYIVTGPILIFFATSVIIPEAPLAEPIGMRKHYYGVSRRFFTVFALLQLWDIGFEMMLGRGFTGEAIFSVAILVLALAMMSSPHASLHILGTIIAWLLFLTFLLLRGIGVVV